MQPHRLHWLKAGPEQTTGKCIYLETKPICNAGFWGKIEVTRVPPGRPSRTTGWESLM